MKACSLHSNIWRFSVHALLLISLQGLLESLGNDSLASDTNIRMLVAYDNEEVGSEFVMDINNFFATSENFTRILMPTTSDYQNVRYFPEGLCDGWLI